MSRTIAALRQLAAALGEAHEREAAPKITAEQSIAGPPLYMAPEAIVAPETVGPPADVYGVGCVAFFLLTGANSLRGRTWSRSAPRTCSSAPSLRRVTSRRSPPRSSTRS